MFFFFSGIEIPLISKEKEVKNQTEFWVVSIHAVKIWGYLNVNLSSC